MTTFFFVNGSKTAPEFYAVYTLKGSNLTFRKRQNEISEADLTEHISKIELYKNGTENLAPVMVDKIVNN